MTRIRLILLSMVAMLALSAAASATASAAVETRYFVEGDTELAASESIAGTVGTAELVSTLANDKIAIVCTKNTLSNATVETVGKSKGEIKYEECGELKQIKGGTLTTVTNCKVTIPPFKFIDLLVAGPGGTVEDEFKPETGTTFVEIEIGGTGCNAIFKGKFLASGSYVASLPKGELGEVGHLIDFTSTGSKVTFNKELASYTNSVSNVLFSGTKKGKTWWAGTK
jgi:hypothetical protein